MWKKYGCEDFGYTRDSKYIISFLEKMASNKIINTTVHAILFTLSGVISTTTVSSTLLLSLASFISPPTDLGSKKFIVFALIQLLISGLRISDIMINNVIKLNRKIREINVNSSFMSSLLELEFDGDFSKFEKDCDVIFNKETYEYSAKELLTIWAILFNGLDVIVKERNRAGNSLYGAVDVPFVIKDEPMTIHKLYTSDKNGKKVLNLENPVIKKLYDKYSKEWEALNENDDFVVADYRLLINDLNAAFQVWNNSIVQQNHPFIGGPFNNNALFDTIKSDYFNIEILENYLRALFLNRNGIDSRLDLPESALVNALFSVGSTTHKFVDKINREHYPTFQILEKILRDDGFLDMEPRRYGKLYNHIMAGIDKDTYVELALQHHKEFPSDVSYSNLQAASIVKFTSFTSINMFYTSVKAIISNVFPKRLIRLLFNTQTNTLLTDDIIGFFAGMLLGPEYIINHEETESIREIVGEYIENETSSIDPFITKYFDDKYKPKEKTDKFNIFMDDEDYIELQRERYKTELSKKGGSSQESLSTQTMEQLVKNGKLLNDNIDESEKISLLTGLMSGSVLESKIENLAADTEELLAIEELDKFGTNEKSNFKDSVRNFLCYMSSEAAKLSKLKSQMFTLNLALAYLLSVLNGKVIDEYIQWKTKNPGKTLEDFTKYVAAADVVFDPIKFNTK